MNGIDNCAIAIDVIVKMFYLFHNVSTLLQNKWDQPYKTNGTNLTKHFAPTTSAQKSTNPKKTIFLVK